MFFHRSAVNYKTIHTEFDPDDGDPAPAPASEEGYNIWGRVATAASTLTVSVSKAWATNIIVYAGEGAYDCKYQC